MVNTVKFSQFASVNLSTTTNKVVGVSAATGGINFQSDYPLTWATSTRPSTPTIGTLGFNTSLSQYEYWNGGAWVQLAAGGTGSVNLGSINELAYYAATGTAISGLLSANSAGLLTNSSGVPSWVAYTGTGAPVLATSPTLTTPKISAINDPTNNLPVIILGSAASSVNFISFSATATGIAPVIAAAGTDTNVNLDLAGKGTGGVGLVGYIDGSNAAPRFVGEFISANRASSSSLSLTNTVPLDILSLSLSPGDWNVEANVFFSATGLTNCNFSAWTSTTSATRPDASNYNNLSLSSVAATTSFGTNTPSFRVNITTTTTVYLSVYAGFTTGAVTACGSIFARRIR